MNRARLFAASAVVALATGAGFQASASSVDGPEAEAAAPTPTTVLQVQLKEYSFEGIPASVTGPEVRFEATNAGRGAHELEIRGSKGELLGEVKSMPPGATGAIQLNLAPGSYVAQCQVPAGSKTHADFGMRQGFAVE
ncbi:MAG: hypothetical protein ACRDV9_03665 [Acidimicrobiia bacterium]